MKIRLQEQDVRNVENHIELQEQVIRRCGRADRRQKASEGIQTVAVQVDESQEGHLVLGGSELMNDSGPLVHQIVLRVDKDTGPKLSHLTSEQKHPPS